MKRIAHEETAVVEADVGVETLPPFEKGGLGMFVAHYDRAMAGVMAIIQFGRIALHYQAETGLPMARICESGKVNYKTAMRYVDISRAADALLSRGMAELPASASAILNAAKSSDADRAEALKAEMEKHPEDPALQDVCRRVLAGEIPVSRWRPAYMGLNRTFDVPRKDTNAVNLAARALASLRTVWGSWDYMPGVDSGQIADNIVATLFGDATPPTVIHAIERAVARRQEAAGLAAKGAMKR